MAKVTREQSERKKQMILNATAESFLEKGFTNTEFAVDACTLYQCVAGFRS